MAYFFFMVLNIRHQGPIVPVTQAKQTDKTFNSLVTVAPQSVISAFSLDNYTTMNIKQ